MNKRGGRGWCRLAVGELRRRDDRAVGELGRRDDRRSWAILALAVAVVALLLVGCGRSGGAEGDSTKVSDAEYLNTALGLELTSMAAYRHSLFLLKGEARAVATKFESQEGEYVDALTKGIRGLGADVTAEPEELDLSTVHDPASALTLLYELESHALDWYGKAVLHLENAAPLTLVTGLGVGHGQHLVVLRELLGEQPLNAAPEAFDGGKVPLPEVPAGG